jgi:hypothetical protein
MQIAIIGLVLALLIPIGLLVAIVKLDRRVRSPQQIERLAHVPLLVSIPYERGRYGLLTHGSNFKVVVIVGGVFLVYGATLVIKMMST